MTDLLEQEYVRSDEAARETSVHNVAAAKRLPEITAFIGAPQPVLAGATSAPLILGPTFAPYNYPANVFATALLQARLNRILAYRIVHELFPQWGGHVTDGNYDWATFLNVVKIQEVGGLTGSHVDGIYGPETNYVMQIIEFFYGITY